jgi:hypothetical protein
LKACGLVTGAAAKRNRLFGNYSCGFQAKNAQFRVIRQNAVADTNRGRAHGWIHGSLSSGGCWPIRSTFC